VIAADRRLVLRAEFGGRGHARQAYRWRLPGFRWRLPVSASVRLAPAQHPWLATFPGLATIDRRDTRAAEGRPAQRTRNAPSRPPNRPNT